jgi:hypothetical protein
VSKKRKSEDQINKENIRISIELEELSQKLHFYAMKPYSAEGFRTQTLGIKAAAQRLIRLHQRINLNRYGRQAS